MKRLSLAVAAAAFLSHSALATVIYDTITPTGNYYVTSSTPRNHLGDEVATLAAGSGQTWKVTSVQLIVLIATTRTYGNLGLNTKFWTGFDGANTTNVFSGQASNVNWGIGSGSINAGGYIYTLDFAANNLAFDIGSGANLGFDFTLTENGQATNDLSFYIKDAVPSPGSSTNGFYRDANGNGVFDTGEARAFSGINNANLAVTVNAEAVPEPTTMALAGIAAVAALRKRAKKA